MYLGGGIMEGFKEVDFMTALKFWDKNFKRVICDYRGTLYEFPVGGEWRSDFKVDGGMILDGIWYIEN